MLSDCPPCLASKHLCQSGISNANPKTPPCAALPLGKHLVQDLLQLKNLYKPGLEGTVSEMLCVTLTSLLEFSCLLTRIPGSQPEGGLQQTLLMVSPIMCSLPRCKETGKVKLELVAWDPGALKGVKHQTQEKVCKAAV